MLASIGIVTAVDNNSSEFDQKFDELMEMYEAREQAKKEVIFTSGIDVNELGEVKNNPNIIEARGKMLIVDTEIKREVLFDRYQQIGENTRDEIIEKYASLDGVVIGQGYNYNGYIKFQILKGSDVDENTLNALYNIIEQEANKVGIENVPVVFEYVEIPHEDVEAPYEVDNGGSLRVITEQEASDIDMPTEEANNSTPGFSALTLLLMFSILMHVRRD
ncbi:hypothetical protein V7O66_13815 [Methanolobus sp. ZRKC3]|uniref:hypothetical protein n=1 Tax=Methanolobus sp. ZRKC3 TaxID=3125786 RepID=UPI003244823C